MGGPKSVACPQSLRCRQSQMEELLQPSVEAMENAWRCSGSSSASRQPVWAPRSKRPPEGSKSSANWLRSAGLFLPPPGLWTGAPRRCSGGGLRRNAARALAIMPCTVPTSEVWTPPAPVRASGVSVCLPASVRLLIPLGAELVSELPRLGISALPVAAFELAEQIALAA